jgi:uncharacterized protein (DUF302 family)
MISTMHVLALNVLSGNSVAEDRIDARLGMRPSFDRRLIVNRPTLNGTGVPAMKHAMAALLLTGAVTFPVVAIAGEPNDMFVIRDTQKPPAEVVSAIKSYVEVNKWLYLAEFKLKGGEVTAVKICYPPIGSDIFAAGMHVTAMMPCGHIAVYKEGDHTRISMLHPKFMTALYPDPNLEKAVKTVVPQFEAMLTEVTK